MKTIQAYEFKDLSKDIQKQVYDRSLNEIVEGELEILTFQLNNGDLSEDEFYHIVGCTKYYAEVTAWFIPACYYEHNKSNVHHLVKECIDNTLYSPLGHIIGNKD